MDANLLGTERRNLNPPYLAAPGSMAVTARDYKWLSLGTRHPRAVIAAMRVGLRAMAGRARGKHLLTMGQALAAGLRIGLQRGNVPVWLSTPLLDLHVEDGRVAGSGSRATASGRSCGRAGVCCSPRADSSATR